MHCIRIWVKVFKKGPSKICGRQSLKNFTWSNSWTSWLIYDPVKLSWWQKMATILMKAKVTVHLVITVNCHQLKTRYTERNGNSIIIRVQNLTRLPPCIYNWTSPFPYNIVIPLPCFLIDWFSNCIDCKKKAISNISK